MLSSGDAGWPAELPAGYDQDAADRDRRDLETLRSSRVAWRVKRRLRYRVGGEDVLLERLAAWDRLAGRDAEVPAAHEVLVIAAQELRDLAAEYREACRPLWGDDDPDVLANARAIARGDVLPWEARHAIAAERERARARGVRP